MRSVKIIVGVGNSGYNQLFGFYMSEQFPPLIIVPASDMNIDGYSCLIIFMVQLYILEYSRYKNGIIHEYSRIILEYSWIIHVHESRVVLP